MGVDYDANFGIGVFVRSIDEYDKLYKMYEESDEECDEPDMEDTLDDLLVGSDFMYELTGNGYSGDLDFIVVMRDPFKDGYDITSKVKAMEKFLKEKGIHYEGEINMVGDICIW